MATSLKQRAKIAAWVLVAAAVATAPVSVSALQTSTQSTTINAAVSSVLSITTSGTVAIGITPTASGAASSASDTVTVATNASGGYAMTLADNDTNTALAGPNSSTIPASSNTFASPAALANNTWGYRIDNVGTFGAGPTTAQSSQANLTGTWALVPSSASPQQIKNTSTFAASDVTTVWYGVKADTSKQSGTYTDSVTYSATTNN